MSFGYGLVTSPAARHFYGEQKGGGHFGDFDRIAIDHLNMSLENVALFFLVCCFLPIALSFIATIYRQYITAALGRVTEGAE